VLGGAITGILGLGTMTWVLGRSTAEPVITWVAALAGAAVGVGTYQLLKSLQDRGTVGWRGNQAARGNPSPRGTGADLSAGRAPPIASPPMVICSEPLSQATDLEAAQLEERLLMLCKEDRQLLQRLLDHERSRQPHLRGADLLRVVIEHFERDNR
jgi:hypothetical protein